MSFSRIGLPSHSAVVRVHLDSHVLGSKISHVAGEVATNPRRDAGARRLFDGHAWLSDSAIACPPRSRRPNSRENKIDDQAKAMLLLPTGDVLGQLLLQSGSGKAGAETREGETAKAFAVRNFDQRNLGARYVRTELSRREHFVDAGPDRPAARCLAHVELPVGIRSMGSARPIQIIGPFHSAAKPAAAILLENSLLFFLLGPFWYATIVRRGEPDQSMTSDARQSFAFVLCARYMTRQIPVYLSAHADDRTKFANILGISKGIFTMIAKIEKRSAFTLMELLVVLGILALLAMLAVPMMSSVYERSRSATQAYSLTDVSRSLENFYALNHKYPDGWDSLIAADGTTPYAKLSPNLLSPNTFFTTTTIGDDQIASLSAAGIGHVFLHDATTDYSNTGTDRRHLGTGTGHDGTANINTLVVIDKAGADGLELLVKDFGLNPNKSATDTTLTRINANNYVVLGLGPKSTAAQSIMQSVPLLEHPHSSSSYSRVLVVFEVPVTGTARAKLVGVLGPDGRALRYSIADYNNANGPQPH